MNQTFLRLLFFLFLLNSVSANNMLVQNVTTTGNNAVNKTIQVQFDISWDNSWRDAINWDAAWIFMKFKDANGLWQHCKLNQTGFTNGSGTANTVQVTADKVGSWLYRSALGAGTFNSTGMQLQWNYGLSGLTDVTGLEVRVFAVEMVYVPEGEFTTCSNILQGFYFDPTTVYYYVTFYPGNLNNKFSVLNKRLTPTLTYYETINNGYWSELTLLIRIKADVGMDYNNDGIIENFIYPTGYRAVYAYKYEMSEQQYADFLNTLTPAQIASLGIAGSSITLTNGQYFSANPNSACFGADGEKVLAYADWSGIRPMSFLEFNKINNGPFQPTSGANYYGFSGNVNEPVVSLSQSNFTIENGNGQLQANGIHDVDSWLASKILFLQNSLYEGNSQVFGFRFVRSVE